MPPPLYTAADHDLGSLGLPACPVSNQVPAHRRDSVLTIPPLSITTDTYYFVIFSGIDETHALVFDPPAGSIGPCGGLDGGLCANRPSRSPREHLRADSRHGHWSCGTRTTTTRGYCLINQASGSSLAMEQLYKHIGRARTQSLFGMRLRLPRQDFAGCLDRAAGGIHLDKHSHRRATDEWNWP